MSRQETGGLLELFIIIIIIILLLPLNYIGSLIISTPVFPNLFSAIYIDKNIYPKISQKLHVIKYNNILL